MDTTDIWYKFTGQELDETGIYNFRARMYDSTIAMFYAADPAHQTFSAYGYVGGNPVNNVDKDGRVFGLRSFTGDELDWLRGLDDWSAQYSMIGGDWMLRTIRNIEQRADHAWNGYSEVRGADGRIIGYQKQVEKFRFTEGPLEQITIDEVPYISKPEQILERYYEYQFVPNWEPIAGSPFSGLEDFSDRLLNKVEDLTGWRIPGTARDIIRAGSTPGGVAKGMAKGVAPRLLMPTNRLTRSTKEMAKLVDDIAKNGIRESIKYVEFNGVNYVVDGHHRLQAAFRLGLKEVPAERVSLPYMGYRTFQDLFEGFGR